MWANNQVRVTCTPLVLLLFSVQSLTRRSELILHWSWPCPDALQYLLHMQEYFSCILMVEINILVFYIMLSSFIFIYMFMRFYLKPVSLVL